MTDTEKVLEILSDGRWHGANEFYGSYLPNFRSRISELRRRFPDRFVPRRRTHTNLDGSTTTANDWRDTSFDGAIRAAIRERHEATGLFGAMVESAIEAEFESYIDPWRES